MMVQRPTSKGKEENYRHSVREQKHMQDQAGDGQRANGDNARLREHRQSKVQDRVERTAIFLFVCLFVCLLVCLFVCLFACLFVCLFVCVSV